MRTNDTESPTGDAQHRRSFVDNEIPWNVGRTRRDALIRARKQLARLKHPDESITDEFLAERRAEALIELKDLDH